MSTIRIIPTNTCPPTLEELARRSKSFSAFASDVQLDVGDGVFVSARSWPYGAGQWDDLERMASRGEKLPESERLSYEAHLMVDDPVRIGELLSRVGCVRIIAHVETLPTESAIHDAFSIWKAASARETGLAFLIDTPLSRLDTIGHACDVVQLMSIATLGAQGAPYDARVIERIQAVHASFPDLPIEIDGGVSSATLPALIRAGATRFGVGSAISAAADQQSAYSTLLSLAQSMIQS